MSHLKIVESSVAGLTKEQQEEKDSKEFLSLDPRMRQALLIFSKSECKLSLVGILKESAHLLAMFDKLDQLVICLILAQLVKHKITYFCLVFF